MRHAEISARNVAAIEAKLRAADTPTPPTFVGAAMQRYIARYPRPEGELPIGHTRHYDVRTDPDTGDALFSASTGLLAKIPELADAQREVPERWRAQPEETGKGDVQPGRAGR